MTAWCRELGIETIMHVGGPSIAGSHHVTAEDVLEAQPDVLSHINGGPTSNPHADIRELCRHAKGALEAVHNGNEKSALVAMEGAMENDRLGDFLIGTDAPAGSGVQPNGMLRMATLLASIGGLPAEQAWCCGTGNVTKKRGLKQGILEAGRSADIVFMDRPSGSEGKNVLEAMAVGNIPGIAAVMIDGKMRTGRSRSTPPSARVPG